VISKMIAIWVNSRVMGDDPYGTDSGPKLAAGQN
jgi:hypothetical protein